MSDGGVVDLRADPRWHGGGELIVVCEGKTYKFALPPAAVETLADAAVRLVVNGNRERRGLTGRQADPKSSAQGELGNL